MQFTQLYVRAGLLGPGMDHGHYQGGRCGAVWRKVDNCSILRPRNPQTDKFGERHCRVSSLRVLSRAKVLAKECIEEPQDEKEEAGEEEVDQEASQVPASDHQVAPEADPHPSKNAHFDSHPSQ